jgi:hypothetical protein
MAGKRQNHHKRMAYILSVYQSEKQYDIPDTFIVAKIFPKYHIFMSYSQWMRCKNRQPKTAQNLQQGSLF